MGEVPQEPIDVLAVARRVAKGHWYATRVSSHEVQAMARALLDMWEKLKRKESENASK